MINFKIVSPGEAIAIAMDEAKQSTDAITKLANTPLAIGETAEGQALKVFRHAVNLAAAFNLLNQITDMVHEDATECPCPGCTARRANDSTRKDPEAGVSPGSN